MFITGDQHAQFDRREKFFRLLSKDQILLTLGDWGFDWSPAILNDYINNHNLDCIQLFCDGNHDNHDYLAAFPVVEIYGGKAHKLADNIYHLMRGEMYEIEGKKYLVLGGALSVDKAYRTPYVSWWPQEQPNGNEYIHAIETLEKYNWTFDYLISHTGATDEITEMFGIPNPVKDSTQDMLSRLIYEIKAHNGRFSKHLFGHMHQFVQRFGDNFDSMCLYDQIYDTDTLQLIN